MRIVVLLLLLGSAPNAAVGQDFDPRAEGREAAREARADRAERAIQRSARGAPAPRFETLRRGPSAGDGDAPLRVRGGRSEGRPEAGGADFERAQRSPADLGRRLEPAQRPPADLVRRLERAVRPAEGAAEIDRPAPGPRVIEAPGSRRRSGDSVADWRLRDRGAGSAPELVQQRSGSVPDTMADRRQRQLERFGRTSPVVSRVPREGTQPPVPAAQRPADRSANHWRGDWRRDHRYDWWNWRRRNRSHFHLGFYFDPFGWAYRRYHVGWRMWPSYYRSSYWLSDPWSYRLPYAPPGHRWIRYYDDALLVDTWDGRVVDVIHNFFW